ncbi:hypothetical protein AWH56_006075 [Anaerobacillus isosaccharinicus]|uniref:Transposase n=1 Tax=Anaerobacillus isosaccharinicus TaxID=1532552 RepID=A0A1S2LXD1_9BACI|nr:hypothetical protein [Anaerobacillus isosaccharinicus]MBA5584410.1 hypothetical protein [Anaerobacillus isosaccharinicus]QOY37199.1 hypothetical protein AWH56_006075 [Anaerobacillus isosaccharinicus]
MARKKVEVFENVKKHYVRMALETNQISSTAKSAGVHRHTLKQWMNEYETEILDQMDAETDSVLPPKVSTQEYKKKYEMAMKLLGEKELEVAILKEALKKNDHL